MKIVINRCYGGFSLSELACEKLSALVGRRVESYDYHDASDRANPNLIKVVEELGDRANTSCSKLKIIEIPDDVDYTISEYDGMETVEEVHRTWS